MPLLARDKLAKLAIPRSWLEPQKAVVAPTSLAPPALVSPSPAEPAPARKQSPSAAEAGFVPGLAAEELPAPDMPPKGTFETAGFTPDVVCQCALDAIPVSPGSPSTISVGGGAV